jgi:DNA-nicking Smr family endonuclease
MKKISPEDIHLWLTHTKDVKKLPKKGKVAERVSPEVKGITRPQLSRKPIEKQVVTAPLNSLARKEVRRIKTEARLDLHGLSLDQAHARLETFLLKAQVQGIRSALIITGKGSLSSPQTIRSMLPIWLKETALRNLVSFIHYPARVEDGGQGAYYVGVRRKK